MIKKFPALNYLVFLKSIYNKSCPNEKNRLFFALYFSFNQL
jgi:hypothetical protein